MVLVKEATTKVALQCVDTEWPPMATEFMSSSSLSVEVQNSELQIIKSKHQTVHVVAKTISEPSAGRSPAVKGASDEGSGGL